MRLFLLLVLLLGMRSSYAQSGCPFGSRCYQPGEELHYHVYYQLGPIWVPAGEVTFSVHRTSFFDRPAFLFKSQGRSFSGYDWVFKVRDRFETLVDSATQVPLHYVRDTKEGGNITFNDVYFNHRKYVVTSSLKHNKEPLKRDTLNFTSCARDVLSMIYAARTIDFEKYAPNSTIPITIFLDGQLFPRQFIRYLGKSILVTKLGTFRCLQFQPRLIAGTIFKEGDEMRVWVTDDENRIPLLVETPILVGSIQTKIHGIKGNLFPLNARISKP